MANKEAERQAAQLRERVAASLSGAATSSQQEAEEANRTLKVLVVFSEAIIVLTHMPCFLMKCLSMKRSLMNIAIVRVVTESV